MKPITLKIDTSNNLLTHIELVMQNDVQVLEKERKTPGDQNVLELVIKLLEKSNLKLHDIQNIEIKTGPGSFTGLRVGASIANALSFALNIPMHNKKLGKIVIPEY